MAKQIVILERVSEERLAFRFLMWASVHVDHRVFYADPAAVSAWRGASTAEIAALRDGSVAERVETFSADPGTSITTIQARLRQRFDVFQAEVSGRTNWSRYGTYYDPPAGWTAGGV